MKKTVMFLETLCVPTRLHKKFHFHRNFKSYKNLIDSCHPPQLTITLFSGDVRSLYGLHFAIHQDTQRNGRK